MKENRENSYKISVIVPLSAADGKTFADDEAAALRALSSWAVQSGENVQIIVFGSRAMISAAKRVLLKLGCRNVDFVQAQCETSLTEILKSSLGAVQGSSVIISNGCDYYPCDYIEKVSALSSERDIVSTEIAVLFPERISDFNVYGYSAFAQADLIKPLDEFIKRGHFWGWSYLANKIIKTDLLKDALRDIEKAGLSDFAAPWYPLAENLPVMVALCSKAKSLCITSLSCVVFDWSSEDNKIRTLLKQEDTVLPLSLQKVWSYLARKTAGHNIAPSAVNEFKESFINRLWWRCSWIFPSQRRAEVKEAIALSSGIDEENFSDSMPKTDNFYTKREFDRSLYRSRFDDDEVLTQADPETDLAYIDKKDTLLACFWGGSDPGISVSAVALYKTFEEIGARPVFLCPPRAIKKAQYAADDAACAFIRENCDVAKRDIPFKETASCRLFAAGPGAVWEKGICADEDSKFFFGDGTVSRDAVKISVSSSFGRTDGAAQTAEDILKTKKRLEVFSCVSLRSSADVSFAMENFSLKADIAPDPVFLCRPTFFEDMAASSGLKEREEYIFTQLLETDERREAYIEEGVKIHSCMRMDLTDFCWEQPMSAQRWLAAVYNSSYVVSDSYYAICFAVIFKKPFSVAAPVNFSERSALSGLLEALGLEERMVYFDQKSDLADFTWLYRKPVNYARVYKKLDALKEEALNWLTSLVRGS